MTEISFPGLGIGEFSINPVAIPFAPNDGIRWYAILIVTGMILAVIYCSYRAKSEGIAVDTMIDFALFTIPVGIIGARLYYVLFDWMSNPDHYKSFRDVIAIREGGLAIYGGIIFGAITVIIVAKVKKMSGSTLLKITDAVAPGVMIAQSLGRWGNFCNGEAFGTPTDLPWGMTINGSAPVHPTFLYESLWNVLGFILINLCYKKKRFDGQIMLMYVSWYGLGRMFIELLRTDSLTNGGSLRISSLVGLLSFVIGGGLLLFFFIKNKGRKAFTPVSATASETNEASAEATIDEDSATEDAATENSECSDGNLSEQEAQEENQESQPKETQETQETQENTNNSEENKNGNID